jgi:PAS domain S-box-containing protein
MNEILIIEDSPTQAEQLVYTLEQNGYKATVARNGKEALELLSTLRPTIIVTDVVMPGMDGFTLCKRLKGDENLKDIPVILLTALSNPEDVLKGLECGADNFITKPYDEHSLLTRIRHILVNAELRKESKMQMGIEIYFRGKKYFITSERQQILDLLLSSYEAAVSRSQELGRTQRELEELNAQLEERITEKTASLMAEMEERRRAEKGIYFLASIVRNMPDAVCSVDSEGKIFSWNEAAEKMLGYKKEEILGKHVTTTIPEELAGKEMENCMAILNAAGFLTGYKSMRLDNNGKLVPVEITAVALKEVGQSISSYSFIMRDISERKKLEEQLLQAQKMEAIGQLAGGIAHDFNNILSAIMGYAHLLHDKLADGPLIDNAEQILESAERGAEVTNSLLAFSRKQMIRLMPIRINDMVRQFEKLLDRIIGEDVELRTTLADEDISVMADAGQLNQVLMNLATNARDAMPDGGVLAITTGTSVIDDSFVRSHGYGFPGPFALVTVSDTGVGMSTETASKIFEPFFTTKEPGKGTGLGLSMVYGIVKQHDGFINVYSEPDRGTTFRIYLPVINAGEEVSVTTCAEPVILRGGSETVLVAEDDSKLRKLAEIVLKEHGYKVILAENGEDAVSKFIANSDTIQLLLLDMIMPKKGGREAYEEIKKIRPDVKVLFATGYTADRVGKNDLLDGGLNFVLKPVSPKDLLMKLREVLDK